jgi:hypothetical protein
MDFGNGGQGPFASSGSYAAATGLRYLRVGPAVRCRAMPVEPH